jgi:uncharacterized protein YcnI
MKKQKKAAQQNPQKLMPYLLYKDVGKALGWFKKAFGYIEFGARFTGEDVTIHDAAMEISPKGDVFMRAVQGVSVNSPVNTDYPSDMIRRSVRFVIAVAGAALIGSFGLAALVAAQVSIDPQEAIRDSDARVAFRVLSERDNATTVKLDPPADSHSKKISEGVSKITWSTQSAESGVKPGRYLDLPISLGRLPTDADTLVFTSLQTYSNGEVVRWAEARTGGGEPEHPAAVLKLKKPGAEAAKPIAANPYGYGITSGRLASLVAAVVGLISVVVGGLALARSVGRIGTGNGRLGAIVAMVAGLIGMVGSGVHLATSTGAFGTGSGRAGAIVAMMLGLIGMVLGGLALVRSRRTG